MKKKGKCLVLGILIASLAALSVKSADKHTKKMPKGEKMEAGASALKAPEPQALKKRAAKPAGKTINTYYIWSYDGKLLAEYDQNNNCTREYIYAGTQLIAEYHPMTDKYYYHMYDQVNSTRMVTDGNGDIVFAVTYGPYGSIQKVWVNTYEPKTKFSGKEQESSTGFYYFGARYYDPLLRRLISPDPAISKQAAISNPQLWNMYSYCRNNPITYLDPDGKRETPYARWMSQRYQVYRQMDGDNYAFNRMMFESRAEFGGCLAIAAFFVGYNLPEIVIAGSSWISSLFVRRGAVNLLPKSGRKIAQQLARWHAVGNQGGVKEFLDYANKFAGKARSTGNVVTGTIGTGPQALENATIYREGTTFY